MSMTSDLPQYRSHKIVRAAKITGFRQNGNADMPDILLDGQLIVAQLPDWHAKHQPQIGGYYVVYEDGYASFSPAKAFEEGYRRVDPFEDQQIRIETIARVAHEVNRAYCQALGDDSQPAWENAPPWQRESARMGVDLHLSGDFGPEASHVAWSKHKLDTGWKYGPAKDEGKKEHHCLVPFADLPREQQAKDFIFRAVVHAMR
jgi:hypothetical protein